MIITQQQSKLLNTLNALRRINGCNPLEQHFVLMHISQLYAEKLAEKRLLVHSKLKDAGLNCTENIAYHTGGIDFDKALRIWVASRVHETNILDNWRYCGCGVAVNREFTEPHTYYVTHFSNYPPEKFDANKHNLVPRHFVRPSNNPSNPPQFSPASISNSK